MQLIDIAKRYQPLIVSLGLRGAFAVSTLLATILLGRILGVQGFGQYVTILSLTLLVAGLAQAGSTQLLVREIPIAGRARDAMQIVGFVLGIGLGFATILIAAMAVVDPERFFQASMQIPLLVVLLIILNCTGATVRGFRHVLAGQIGDALIRPLSLIGILLVLLWVASPLDFRMALWCYVAALGAGVLFNCALLLAYTRKSNTNDTEPVPITIRSLGRGMLGLGVLGWFAALNTQLPPYLAGTLGAPEQAGLFRVAMQFAAILTMGLSAVEFAQGPHYSVAYKADDRRELHALLQKSCRFGTAIAVPSGLALFFAASGLIDLLFGFEFAEAATAVQILALGTMVNAVTGNVGILLIACNAERGLMLSSGVAIVMLIILCILLIPTLGATGAAIGFSSALCTRNIVNGVIAWRHIGILAFPFAPPPPEQVN